MTPIWIVTTTDVELFIPTTSTDGTCDVLIDLFKDVDVPTFRWNVDLWEHYEIRIDNDRCEFTDPTGRLVDVYNDDVFLLSAKALRRTCCRSPRKIVVGQLGVCKVGTSSNLIDSRRYF